MVFFFPFLEDDTLFTVAGIDFDVLYLLITVLMFVVFVICTCTVVIWLWWCSAEREIARTQAALDDRHRPRKTLAQSDVAPPRTELDKCASLLSAVRKESVDGVCNTAVSTPELDSKEPSTNDQPKSQPSRGSLQSMSWGAAQDHSHASSPSFRNAVSNDVTAIEIDIQNENYDENAGHVTETPRSLYVEGRLVGSADGDPVPT